jgi:cytochrome c biogenesis protein CcmG/thiol:disulfide interchange protein DsbE
LVSSVKILLVPIKGFYIYILKIMRFNLLLLFILVLAFLTIDAQTKDEQIASVSVKNIDNQPVNLQNYFKPDKITIICLWATWCSCCKGELDTYSELLNKWKQNYNVEFLAISLDDSRSSMKVKPFVVGNKWNFPVLIDINQDLKRYYGFTNPPGLIVIDKKGNIALKKAGYKEGDEYEVEDLIKKLN